MRTETNSLGNAKLWFWLMQGICFFFAATLTGDVEFTLGYLLSLALLNVLVLSLWSRLQNAEIRPKTLRVSIILSPVICLVTTAAAVAVCYGYYH